MVCSIYKITNLINGKSYIGFTSKNPPELRWKEHVYNASFLKYYLYRAIRKEGAENFSFEVICQSLDWKHCLYELESYFIDKYNTKSPNGYNMTDGGKAPIGRTISAETRIKMSISAKKRIYTKRRKKRIDAGKPRVGYNILPPASFEGKIHTEPSKERMRSATKQKWENVAYRNHQSDAHCKFLYEIIFPDGRKELVRSIIKFAKENNLAPQHLYDVINRHYKQSKGYMARRLENE